MNDFRIVEDALRDLWVSEAELANEHLVAGLAALRRIREAAEMVALSYDSQGGWLYPELREVMGMAPVSNQGGERS